MYLQDNRRLFSQSGLDEGALDAMRPRAEAVRNRLIKDYHEGALPLLSLPSDKDDLIDLNGLVEKLAPFKEIVILGTGGSSLGGQTLNQLASPPSHQAHNRPLPKLTFLDNLDPHSLQYHLASPDLTHRHYVAISKSGTTSETLIQTITVIEALQKAGKGDKLSEHISAITEPEQAGRTNGLRALVSHFGGTILDHHTGIGGRYTCLTNVGLLPALLAGLDSSALRQGAEDSVASLLNTTALEDCPPLYSAAIMQALSETKGIQSSVMMGYGDRFERLSAWYVQLWAESLGKQGLGTTPIAALGPVDQHSQLQLFLDGPQDKVFTLLSYGMKEQGPMVNPALAEIAGADSLGHIYTGDLVSAQVLAVRDALSNRGRPVRHIHLPELGSQAFGGLLMHFMIETIATGYLMNIDPFDQPAVEEAKILTREYISTTG